MRKAVHIMLVAALLVMASCSTGLEKSKVIRGNAIFTRYIAVGGSETAGFADGALYMAAQQNSYPAMLANQFSLASTISFSQPFYPNDMGVAQYNGQFVPKLMLGFAHFSCGTDSMFIPGRIAAIADTGGFSVYGTGYNNLGIPGLRASDVLNPNLAQSNLFYHRINGDSAVSMLATIQRNPASFFTVWLGTQDILEYALAGGGGATIPSAGAFQVMLDSVLNAVMLDTNAGGVIANIPDITEFPYFNAIAYNGLALDTGLAKTLNTVYANRYHFNTGANPFIIADATAPGGNRQITADEKVVLSTPLDSIKCKLLGSVNPLPTNDILDANEVARIQQAVRDYNQVIATAAAARHIPLVDLNALYHSLKIGLQYNGVLFTNVLVNGYFFSLDGLNPSYRGNALIANEFIKQINSRYRSTIPSLDPTTFTGPLFQ